MFAFAFAFLALSLAMVHCTDAHGSMSVDFCSLNCKRETFDLVVEGFIRFQAGSVEMNIHVHLLLG